MFRIMIIHASVTSSLGTNVIVQFSTASSACIFYLYIAAHTIIDLSFIAMDCRQKLQLFITAVLPEGSTCNCRYLIFPLSCFI